jgi:DNA mismatch repair protein MutL
MFPIREFTKTSEDAAPSRVEQADNAAAAPCDGPPSEASPLDAPDRGLALGDGPPPTPLGQIGRTYIVAEWGDDLLMIDQHAAHERLIYQRLVARASGAVASQPLLIPLPVSVATADTNAMEALAPLLGEMGIDLEPQGQGEYAVTAMPAEFDSIDAAAVIQDILDEAQEADLATGGLDALRDRARVRMACHAAVKAGQQLHVDEMSALITEMAEARLSFTCPHGRPTMVLLRKGQLDRQFGREG